MKNLIDNIWADLREKRLWPVAALLLAALVAVPLVLKKAPEEPPPAQPVAAAPRAAPESKELKGLASVKLVETLAENGSSLDAFVPEDPFRPPQRVVEDAQDELDEGVALDEEITIGEDFAEGGTGLGSGDTGGGETGSGGEDTGGDTGGGTGEGDGPITETIEYTYVLDVTFTDNGRTRKIKGLQRLDLLPSTASPLLLFVGVSADAGDAVFLVDSKLQGAGEGRCEPSNAECGFLYLGAGSEHMFTTVDGDSYELRIDQIRKVKLIEPDERQPKAAISRAGARQRFTPPLISDLLSVSRTAVDNSNRGRSRR